MKRGSGPRQPGGGKQIAGPRDRNARGRAERRQQERFGQHLPRVVADGTQVDGIDLLELAEDRVGQDLPGPQISLRAQIIGNEIQLGPGYGRDRLQDPNSLGDDLGADAVARDDRDPKRHRLQHNRQRFSKGLHPVGRYHYIVLTEERALNVALDKMRRMRRVRRLSRLTYWAAWGFVGVVCLLLLAGGVAGLASG